MQRAGSAISVCGRIRLLIYKKRYIVGLRKSYPFQVQ